MIAMRAARPITTRQMTPATPKRPWRFVDVGVPTGRSDQAHRGPKPQSDTRVKHCVQEIDDGVGYREGSHDHHWRFPCTTAKSLVAAALTRYEPRPLSEKARSTTLANARKPCDGDGADRRNGDGCVSEHVLAQDRRRWQTATGGGLYVFTAKFFADG